MAGARLTTYVHLLDEQGVTHHFGPDDDVPAWARKAITNPDVWDTAEESEEVAVAVEEPPRGGAGSGRDEWAAYAASLGIEVVDGMSRDEIIEAVDGS